jgi:hypothetical protein
LPDDHHDEPHLGRRLRRVHRASGAAFAPDVQVGLEPTFGANVHPLRGATMLTLSSGHARTSNQPFACGMESCAENTGGTPPAGFPQAVANCPPSISINDDVSLDLSLRVPTNAVGYAFDFKFHSFDFPEYVCTTFNDQFIALVAPAPAGAINGNVAFDAMHNPVSVNMGFFDVCDPSAMATYASNCLAVGGTTCPSPPAPYCPSGTSQLFGTGFDVWATNGSSTYGGATTWLRTQAPAQPGALLTIRFIIWDTGDQQFDSTVLIDGFQWILAPGTVAVSTAPVP